jgi:hypothetical protein
VTLGAALAGCSGATGYGACNVSYLTPAVRLLYPLPNAQNVPDAAGVVLYASAPNYLPATAVPILLRAGSATPFPTVPTAVPSPYPSPAATTSASLYAVAVPSLAPATTYHVLAEVSAGNCYGSGSKVQQDLGSFTTR